jgi:hypothetical protein
MAHALPGHGINIYDEISKARGAKKNFFFPYQPNSSLFMLLTISLVLLLVYFVTLNGGHPVPKCLAIFCGNYLLFCA